MSEIIKELVPSTKEMMNWATEIVKQGIRRPGYPADYWAENWVKNQYISYNLQDIKLDPVIVKKWESHNAKLIVWLNEESSNKYEIPCFPIPYTSPTDSHVSELCMITDKSQLTGKIAVSEFKLSKIPVKILKYLVKSVRYYDPKNEFESLEQILPFDMRFQKILEPALENDASGFIGILSGYPWESDNYYVPYDAIERKIPSVWVSKKNGEKILQLMKKGKVSAEIFYNAKISEVISHNITGTLPGMSNEWILIGSHHDGPWNSAVEDASGMVLVLAQAEYWSKIPKEKRPFNLMFLMNCGHMAGGVGQRTFINRYKDFLPKVISAIHLEHVARDVKINEGNLIPLDQPTVRWWFVSRILQLEEITEKAIIKEDLHRSLLLPPDDIVPGLEGPPSDANSYYSAGVPFISFLTAPPYLFDSADTLDKVHDKSFEPLTRAVIRIINSLKSLTAKGLRDQILTKKERQKIKL